MPSPGQVAASLQNAGMKQSVPLVNTLLKGFKHMSVSITNEMNELFGTNLDRDEELFWFDAAVSPTRVLAGAIDTQATFTVGTEGDFVAVACMAQAATTATPPVPVENGIRFSVRDGGTGRDLTRTKQPLGFAGQGVVGRPASASPLFFPKPRFFGRTTQVFVRFDNVQGADLDVDFLFWGYRIFDSNQLDLTRAR
jgi:hypothetical protein